MVLTITKKNVQVEELRALAPGWGPATGKKMAPGFGHFFFQISEFRWKINSKLNGIDSDTRIFHRNSEI